MKIALPCLQVKLVPLSMVRANTYNPNHVPKDKMELLRQSIIDNGLCFPLVTIFDKEEDCYVIVDGFHRYTCCQELGIDPVPVVVLEHDMTQRMHATIQFNKARGIHEIDKDAQLVRALIDQGEDELEISKHLGLDLDTIQRYKSLTGILELFRNVDYSKAWEVEDDS